MITEDEEQELRRRDLKELTKSIVALADAQSTLAEQVKHTNGHAIQQVDLQRAGNRLTRATNIRTTIAIALGGLSLALIIIISVVYFTAGRKVIETMNDSKTQLEKSASEIRALRKESEETQTRISGMEEQVKEQIEDQPKVVADEKGKLSLAVPLKDDAKAPKPSVRKSKLPTPLPGFDVPPLKSASKKQPRALIPLDSSKGIHLKAVEEE